MADNGKGMIMGRSSCDWVHDWLPLLVDNSDGLACEGNDLNAEDRCLIEQHLAECPSCRQHQAALEEAVSVLSIAAADVTAALRTPSLWPRLEERIERDQKQSRSRWLRTLRAICPEGIRVTADRFYCGCGQFHSNLPLQLAWTRDSLGDFLANRAWSVFSSRRSRPGTTFRLVTPRVGFGFSLAVAGMVLFLLVVVTQRRQTQSEARIAADTASPPSMQLPLSEMPEASEDVVTATSSSTVSRASDSLSLASPAVPAAAASMGQIATAKTASTITTTTATATSAPRYDFDLEHGTPMPPETRAAKPAY
jgi:Putative zinc-finger